MGRNLMGGERHGANKVTVPHSRSAGSSIRAGERGPGTLLSSSSLPFSRGIPNPVPRYLSLWGGRCRDPARTARGSGAGSSREWGQGAGGGQDAQGELALSGSSLLSPGVQATQPIRRLRRSLEKVVRVFGFVLKFLRFL